MVKKKVQPKSFFRKPDYFLLFTFSGMVLFWILFASSRFGFVEVDGCGGTSKKNLYLWASIFTAFFAAYGAAKIVAKGKAGANTKQNDDFSSSDLAIVLTFIGVGLITLFFLNFFIGFGLYFCF